MKQKEPIRPGTNFARGLRGATYGPANAGRRLSPEEVAKIAAQTGEPVSHARKPKKFATPKRARAANLRAKKNSAGMWNRYGKAKAEPK